MLILALLYSFCQIHAQCLLLMWGMSVLLLQIAGSSSWHARYTVLTYLQIMVFYNLFTFMTDQKAVNGVRSLVIQLLEDEQLEVNCERSFTAAQCSKS